MNVFVSICKLRENPIVSKSVADVIRYVMYHSLLAIVRQCYRPSEDGDEMEARRNLTAAVKQLSSV